MNVSIRGEGGNKTPSAKRSTLLKSFNAAVEAEVEMLACGRIRICTHD